MDVVAEPQTGHTAWWGEWPLEVGEVRRWKIGAATLWVARYHGEWRVYREVSDDPFSEALEIATRSDLGELGDEPPLRFAGGEQGHGRIRMTPRLADLNVISRPETRFSILPESNATVFIGSPAWVALEDLGSGRTIVELPLLPPARTWFGANTREGEFGYAARTRCRMQREELRWTPHRAVTEVTIRNPHPTPLPIDRISVPAPVLPLWVAEGGGLITSPITYTREQGDSERAELEVGGAPSPGAKLLVAPREATAQRGLMRAFSRLI